MNAAPPGWEIVLRELAQGHQDVLADMPSMTWAERWALFQFLRRQAEGRVGRHG